MNISLVIITTNTTNDAKKNQFNELRNGILYLKGGDLTEELEEFGGKYEQYSLADYFTEEFFETKKVVYVPI